MIAELLQTLRVTGAEIIVSDGGSEDATARLSRPLCDHWVDAPRGRAAQMNHGAAAASKEWLWFVHADTRFTAEPAQLIAAIASAQTDWGFFSICLDAPGWRFRSIEYFMNLRSRVSRIGTGDQGLFVRKSLFDRLGGFASIPLMEDVEISKRLRQLGRPCMVRQPLLTSARRWQRHGVLRTVLLMWRLRLAYFLGVSPQRLAGHYRACSSPTHES